MRSLLLSIQVFALFCVVCMPANAAAQTTRAADPDKDPQMRNLLREARRLIDSKQPAGAIARCDQVIAAFQAHYGSSKQKAFCARTSAESLGVLLKAAADKNSATVLSSTWSDALFMKAFSLEDLRRLGEAKTTLQEALRLSLLNSQYLSELGQIYQLEKDWPKAKQAFEEAEDQAKLSPPESQADELGRARRGLGYVLVELGQLDQAEKKYQQCLAADPNDARAKRELEYVRALQAKKAR